ncbi:MAG: ATP-binding cassette domain-containing protein [Candidatus Moduliflexus flocculans]|nr:ATP-binding cassette domain-containing protein [Candidatus Moduliflexus flocculans]
MALLEVHNLVKAFGGLKANDDVSFSLEQGELLGLIGPNGAGKTTLFNCIAGMFPPTSGRIVFDGEDVTALGAHEMARRGLARTFQVYVAAGDLNVLENVMVGCFLHTRSQAQRQGQGAKAFSRTSGLQGPQAEPGERAAGGGPEARDHGHGPGHRPQAAAARRGGRRAEPQRNRGHHGRHPPHPRRPRDHRDADRARHGAGHEHQPAGHRPRLRQEDRRGPPAGRRPGPPGHQGLPGRTLRARTRPRARRRYRTS